MKKTFSFIHPKINTDRRIEAIKYDIKKYLKRERKKALPADMDFWGFNCKFGLTESEAEEIHEAKINKKIDEVHAQGLTSFYIEIIADARKRLQQANEDHIAEAEAPEEENQ